MSDRECFLCLFGRYLRGLPLDTTKKEVHPQGSCAPLGGAKPRRVGALPCGCKYILWLICTCVSRVCCWVFNGLSVNFFLFLLFWISSERMSLRDSDIQVYH